MTSRHAAVRMTPNDERAARLLAQGVLGHRKDGSPIYPVGGGAPDDGGDGGSGDGGSGDGDGDGSGGDGGDGDGNGTDGDGNSGDDGDETDWRAKFERAQREARKWERRAKANRGNGNGGSGSGGNGDGNGDGNDGGDQVDPEKIRAEVRAEVMRERVADKIEAAVAGKFVDDEAAALILAKRGADEFLDDGQIDTDAIKDAVADLLKERPHLGKNTRRPAGDVDQGGRGKSGGGKKSLEDAIAERFNAGR